MCGTAPADPAHDNCSTPNRSSHQIAINSPKQHQTAAAHQAAANSTKQHQQQQPPNSTSQQQHTKQQQTALNNTTTSSTTQHQPAAPGISSSSRYSKIDSSSRSSNLTFSPVVKKPHSHTTTQHTASQLKFTIGSTTPLHSESAGVNKSLYNASSVSTTLHLCVSPSTCGIRIIVRFYLNCGNSKLIWKLLM